MKSTQSFDTAAKNMEFDRHLIKSMIEGDIYSFFRLYQWQHRGLTQSEKRDIPQDLYSFDHALRPTGGGLVFHCPGDFVFSCGAPINHPILPPSVKQRCHGLATDIMMALNDVGLPVTLAGDSKQHVQNIQFCSTYHNPYECMLGNQKISGIALKKTRHWIVVQGVIHLQSTWQWYADISRQYEAMFTTGCTTVPYPSSETVKQSVWGHLEQRF